MGELFNTILHPLEVAVSWVLIALHNGLVSLGLPPDSGWSWGPAIVLLVVLVRIMLIPIFVKQIRAQRGLQLLQPKMAELRKKYGSDRQKMSEELMKLYKETGTNPFSSCLPILAQAPFFFGLYRTMDAIARNHPRGVLTEEEIASAQSAKIFGAPLPDSFISADTTATRIVILCMIVAMCASQFLTQRQIMLKNMPGGGDNPMAQQQKILLYVFPLVFAVSGVYFPVGVLLYWLTTNLWTMGQQFYVIRNMPAPGSKAEEALMARKAAKAKASGQPAAGSSLVTEEPAAPAPPPRQQPKRQSRTQRKTVPPPKKVAASGAPTATKPATSAKPAAPKASAKAKPPATGTPGTKPPAPGTPSPNGKPSPTPTSSTARAAEPAADPGADDGAGTGSPVAGDSST